MWTNFSYQGARSVIQCLNLTYVPTTAVVAVVVNGFSPEKFDFSPPYTVMAGIGPANSLYSKFFFGINSMPRSQCYV